MEALYAFLRITDDLADQPAPAFQRQAALEQWRRTLDQALQQGGVPRWGGLSAQAETSEDFFTKSQRLLGVGSSSGFCLPPESGLPPAVETLRRPVGQEPGLPESTGGGMASGCPAILPALVHTVRQFRIPPLYLDAVLEGVGMDVAGAEYRTFEQLAGYCRRVASAVGLACLCIWDCHHPDAVQPAIACGLAFQLTNILRDLKEDARMGRVYLPSEELAAWGYSVENFPPSQADERFDQLVCQQVERARSFYRQAAELRQYLASPAQRIFGMMYQTYRRLLERIAQNPRIVLAERVRLSGWEKLALALRWTLWPSSSWW